MTKRKVYEISLPESASKSEIKKSDHSSFCISPDLTFFKQYNVKNILEEIDFEHLYIQRFKSHLTRRGLQITSEINKKLFYWFFAEKAEAYEFSLTGEGWDDIFLFLPNVRLDLNTSEAKKILKGEPDYSFVIRLSDTYARCFVVSLVLKGVVSHRRLLIEKYEIILWSLMMINGIKVRRFLRTKDNFDCITMNVVRFAAANCEEKNISKTSLVKTSVKKIKYDIDTLD